MDCDARFPDLVMVQCEFLIFFYLPHDLVTWIDSDDMKLLEML